VTDTNRINITLDGFSKTQNRTLLVTAPIVTDLFHLAFPHCTGRLPGGSKFLIVDALITELNLKSNRGIFVDLGKLLSSQTALVFSGAFGSLVINCLITMIALLESAYIIGKTSASN